MPGRSAGRSSAPSTRPDIAAVLVVAGWTATGKTRLARSLASRLDGAVVLSLDDYYRDVSHLPRKQRVRHDFDRPEALDMEGFARDLAALREGKTAPLRRYEAATGRNLTDGVLGPARWVLAEGVFTFHDPRIRGLADSRVLLTGDPERLLERRLVRDTAERGYSPAEVRRMFRERVLPAQSRYLAGAEAFADLVLPMDWSEAHVERCLRLVLAKGNLI